MPERAPPKKCERGDSAKVLCFYMKVPLEGENGQTAAEGLRVTVPGSSLTAFLQVFRASNIKMSKRLQRGCGSRFQGGATVRKYGVFTVKVLLEGENGQTAAEGLRVTVAVSGLTAFLQVFRASNIKVSKRLQRGVGYGSREQLACIFTGVQSRYHKSGQTAAEWRGLR